MLRRSKSIVAGAFWGFMPHKMAGWGFRNEFLVQANDDVKG
jgi:hypothetical protein